MTSIGTEDAAPALEADVPSPASEGNPQRTAGFQDPAIRDPGSPLVFGPPARLLPIPRRVAAPAQTSAQVPQDTAIEWVDTQLAEIRGVCVRGHMKRYEGELRQDSMALGEYGGYIWVAVADGVGSAALSHVGSALAALAAATGGFPELQEQLDRALAEGGGETRHVRLSQVATAISQKAEREGVEPRDLSTTLVLAAIPAATKGEGPVDVVVWQIGDSPIGRIAGGQLTIIGDTDDDALSNSAVAALPLHDTAAVRVERLNPGETLVLMTDGVSNAALANQEYNSALAQLWASSAPTPAALLQVVDATVKSFDDDRTFVGIRFCGEEL